MRKACWGYLCRGGAVELKEVCLTSIIKIFFGSLFEWIQNRKVVKYENIIQREENLKYSQVFPYFL